MAGRVGLCSLILFAAATAVAGPYAEIRGGLSQVDDLTGTADGVDDAAWTAELTFDRKKTVGAEGGLRGIADTPFGIGLALDGFRSRLSQAVVSASVAGTGQAATMAMEEGTDTLQITLDAEAVRELGFNFDDRVTVLSANGFYELGDDEGLAVYLGVGYGIASIGDADLRSGLTVHLGARYPIDPIGYISLRVSRFQSDGVMDDSSGLQFDSFATTGVTLAFGMEF